MKAKIAKFTIIACASFNLFAIGYACAAPKASKDGEMRDVATCADGKIYRNTTGNHMGACSGHGGVIKWADGSPVKSHKRSTEYK